MDNVNKFVYAKDVIETIEGLQVTGMPAFNYGLIVAKDAIAKMPAADVQEVKHGEWLCINGTIFCSECRGKALYEYDENDNDDFPFLVPMRSKRCPHCGAIMKLKEEEEE